MTIEHCRNAPLQSKWIAPFFVSLTLLSPWLTPCHAADVEVTQVQRVVTVDEAGRATAHTTLKINLSSDIALQNFSQFPIDYNAELQSVSVDAAETIHADGTHVVADLKSAVFDRAAPVTITAPQFSAAHLRIVAFPAVTKGDTVLLSYTVTDLDTLYPGKFTDLEAYPPTSDFRDASVTLDTPADMLVNVDAPGMQAQQDSVQGGRHVRIYRYHTPSSGPVAPQANALTWTDIGPYFLATNFRDYAEIGQAYHARSGEQDVPSAAIQTLADSLTGGVTDRREQATRLYDWVSRNVRYVGVYIGAGPVVPRSADVVLSGRYGDCKDHVTLFAALLKAKHIESHSVLVNSGNGYRLPNAPDFAVFSHAITWLPEFKVFADTTAGFAPFGTLTFGTSDKPALDTANGAILHTPPQNETNSRSSVDYALNIDDEGDAHVTAHAKLSGQVSIGVRQTFSQQPRTRIEYEMLRRVGLTGALHVTPADPDELEATFTLSLSGKLDQLAIMPGPAAFSVPRMPSFDSIQGFAETVLRQMNSPLDGSCSGTGLREHYVVEIPHKAKILAIPSGISMDSGEISYHSSYSQHDNTVEIERVLERRLTSNVCSGAKLAEWAGIANAISKDLKRQVLYK